MTDLPKCRYCDFPVKCLGAVVCANPTCGRLRRNENARRSEAKRRALGLKKDHGNEGIKAPPSKYKLVDCLGLGCNAKVKSPVDKWGVALNHFCPVCLKWRRNHDLRFIEV